MTKPVSATLGQQLTDMADAAAEEVSGMLEAVDEAQGDTAFGQRRLSRSETMERYLKMRDDPMAWGQLIARRGPVEAARYGITHERILRRE
jgi:hypothetical protein